MTENTTSTLEVKTFHSRMHGLKQQHTPCEYIEMCIGLLLDCKGKVKYPYYGKSTFSVR